MQLTGRRVLVTGGAGGIGAAIARAMAECGARVMVADRAIEPARATAAAIGPAAMAVEANVASEPSVQAMVTATLDAFGGLDVLVHCAGIGTVCDFLDLSLAEWRRVLAVNLDGSFLCCRAVARIMRDQGSGSIVAIASTAGERPSARAAPYSASKAALINMIRTMAIELAPFGIRANAISPGPVETELVKTMHSDAMRRAFATRTPLARYAQPHEIAGAAVFLASDAASYVTGEVIRVDGGYSSSGITLPREGE